MADKKQAQEPEAVDVEAAEPDAVMSKQELLNLMATPRETRVVDGLKLRGLSGEEYQALQAMRVSGAQEAVAKGGDTQRAFRTAETIAWLLLGVVEPKLSETEWKNLMADVPAGRIENWLAAIRELTGIEEMEVQLAKKALGRMAAD